MDYSGQRIAQYQVIEKLGQGGMATVYRAYDTRLERDVAIKVVRKESIPPEQLERILKRFEREAKSLAKFLHPNIVPVHDYGEFEGAPYLVMAYLPGGTLKDRIGSPVPVQEALSYVTPIANALAYAHRRGVIHRDVKPSNILITEDSTVMLSDFGIAQILEESTTQLTATGMGVGTPEYMASEQWQGEANEASDQYALGVVLYELLTGQKPFSAETPLAVALKVMSDPLPKPSGLVSGIPEELEKVLYKALARDPQDRYGDMEGFANNLRDFLAGTETANQARQIQIAQPMKPTSELPTDSICESVTRDKLDVTPAGGIPKPKAIEIAKKKGLPKWVGWALGGIVGLILFTLALNLVSKSANTTNAHNTQSATSATKTEDAIVATTETTAPTLNATITFTPEPTLGIGSILTNEIDEAEMVFVPAGEFPQGIDLEEVEWIREQSWCTWTTYYNNGWHTTTCSERSFSDSVPKHAVYLDSFWIYQTEVTNSQYAEFLNEVGNKKEGALDPGAAGEDVVYWYGYLNTLHSIDKIDGVWQVQSGLENYPVSEITWYGADAYCEWAGGRLPTESEWEKVARGIDERLFPWGDEIPNSQLTNFGDSEGPQEVGSFPNGISPYGALDMAGNVSEWVADTYNAYYYADSPYENPLGPNAGTFRVYRGGDWEDPTYMLLVIMRGGTHAATSTNETLGFRCVVDP